MDSQTSEQQLAMDVIVRLTHTFGAPFERWRRIENAWRRDGDPPAPSTPHAMTPLLDEAVAARGRALARRTPDGQLWVGVRLSNEQDIPVVAATVVEDDADTFAARLADRVIATERAELQNAEQQLLLDGYAHRMADNFEELTFLRQLSRHVEYCDATRGLGDVAETVLPPLCDLMAIESIALFGASHAGDRPRMDGLLASTGYVPRAIESCHPEVEKLVESSAGVVVRNYDGLAKNRVMASQVRAIVVAPLAKDGHVFGWLVGCNKRAPVVGGAPLNSLGHDEIGSMEASLLEAAAGLLATHTSNVKLFHEKEELIVEAIHTLVGVIEAKDAYTCGHSDRVALIAQRLGKQLGLAAEECHAIYLCGLLHDIGKVGVADDVLLKPGKLNPEEFVQIKRHPEIGYRMLQRLKPLEHLLPGVLNHHEAIDGSGYPNGLQGEDIPLHARVLAVADAWDAMTSDRPYRDGLAWDKAESILRDGAGTQWDAEVLDAFFAAREDVHAITLSWKNHLKQILKPCAAAVQKQAAAAPLDLSGGVAACPASVATSAP